MIGLLLFLDMLVLGKIVLQILGQTLKNLLNTRVFNINYYLY